MFLIFHSLHICFCVFKRLKEKKIVSFSLQPVVLWFLLFVCQFYFTVNHCCGCHCLAWSWQSHTSVTLSSKYTTVFKSDTGKTKEKGKYLCDPRVNELWLGKTPNQEQNFGLQLLVMLLAILLQIQSSFICLIRLISPVRWQSDLIQLSLLLSVTLTD